MIQFMDRILDIIGFWSWLGLGNNHEYSVKHKKKIVQEKSTNEK